MRQMGKRAEKRADYWRVTGEIQNKDHRGRQWGDSCIPDDGGNMTKTSNTGGKRLDLWSKNQRESVRLCVWLKAMQWEHNTSKKNTSLLPFYFRDTASVSVNTEEPGRAARKRVRLIALTCQNVSERFRGQSRRCFQSNSAWKSS